MSGIIRLTEANSYLGPDAIFRSSTLCITSHKLADVPKKKGAGTADAKPRSYRRNGTGKQSEALWANGKHRWMRDYGRYRFSCICCVDKDGVKTVAHF